ncbi:expansin EXLX1 family cellulose-binding protein [Dactylosporangium sp. NPDC006015]|uniref:expansin EXLX1 family cellulose-binding protein n=1 Tax=Dactylosporangium sp. NPDC006015 TaxID=3154576 RepID=UPI0033BB8203
MERRHLRWIIPAAGGVLAVVVSLVLVLQDTGEAACASVPAAPAAPAFPALAPVIENVRSGSASYYSTNRNGMCNLGAPSTDAYAAIGPAEWAGGAACGSYLAVTGPNGQTTNVQVVDQCPSCPAGKIDLSKGAFSRIGSVSAGIIQITYGTVRDPDLAGPLKVRAKGGTGYSSLSVVLDNHGNRLSTVELQTAAGWTPLKHNTDNTWTGPSGLTGPVTLRVTDASGHQVTLSGIALGSSVFQQTPTLMYSPAPPSPSPSPSPSESPSAAATTPVAAAAASTAPPTC